MGKAQYVKTMLRTSGILTLISALQHGNNVRSVTPFLRVPAVAIPVVYGTGYRGMITRLSIRQLVCHHPPILRAWTTSKILDTDGTASANRVTLSLARNAYITL
jgi:hypothetical protein